MVELIRGLDPARVAANLERVREQVDAAAAGRRVRILAATKYIPDEELPALAGAGVELVGENRAQDLERKLAAHGELFEWHFIGQLQSRKVRAIAPHVSLIHSVASRSALRELAKHARPGLSILLEVNVSGEEGKAGIAPAEIAAYIAESAVPVAGLMTMPPLTADPEASRPWFAALAALAREHGLAELSMGTSQDFPVAVQEGASIVRIGTTLYDQ